MRLRQFFFRFSLGVGLLVLLYLAAWLLPDRALPQVQDYRESAIFQPQAPPALPTVHVEATAYCACPICCGSWSDGRTASGTWATEGRTLAADPRFLPMGTCLALPGLGERFVEDTGSAILGPRIDVFFVDHERALEFGRQLLLASKC
jgi:3D (Asp-Asp-Asp) domain-containing protein